MEGPSGQTPQDLVNLEDGSRLELHSFVWDDDAHFAIMCHNPAGGQTDPEVCPALPPPSPPPPSPPPPTPPPSPPPPPPSPPAVLGQYYQRVLLEDEADQVRRRRITRALRARLRRSWVPEEVTDRPTDRPTPSRPPQPVGGCNGAYCARYSAKCKALGDGWELATWQDLEAYDPGLLKPLLTSVCMVHNLESAMVARYSPPTPGALTAAWAR